jgi:excisionase family DNA binding protein
LKDSSTDSWITVAEASARLAVNQKTLRAMIARGEIEARRFGPRLIRVNWASVIANARPLGGAAA